MLVVFKTQVIILPVYEDTTAKILITHIVSSLVGEMNKHENSYEPRVKPAYGTQETHAEENAKESEDKFVEFLFQSTSLRWDFHGIHHNLQIDQGGQETKLCEHNR